MPFIERMKPIAKYAPKGRKKRKIVLRELKY
jgi:hypothetical protein